MISNPKSSVTLITPDTHQAKTHPSILVEDSRLSLVKCTRILGYLRAKLLVACLVVTPGLWLNLSDSRNILIIHFGLLLKERTLDSIGHDLWKKYNVIYTVDSYWCIVGF